MLSNQETKDIGIVLLPNGECKNFANSMTESAAKELPSFIQLPNNPHITIIHIANQTDKDAKILQDAFKKFYKDSNLQSFKFPIIGIKATGGSPETGYKWLDLQFKTPQYLSDMRSEILKTFCPLHKSILTRMHDDPNNFIKNTQNKKDIDECGVTFTNYLPHITTWYIDLPKETKTNKLEDIAKTIDPGNLSCIAEDIALVELGRNGNAIKIIEKLPLINKTSDSYVIPALFLGILAIYLFLRNKKK